MPPAIPSSDDSFLLLHAAVWSIGDAAYLDRRDGVPVLAWLVTGTKGEGRIRAGGRRGMGRGGRRWGRRRP